MGPEIHVRWFTPAVVVQTIFAVFWIVFLAGLWLPGMIREGGTMLAWVILVAFSLVGLALGYTALAGLCNTTRIALEPERLVLRSGPIPCGRVGEYARADIVHVYGQRLSTRSGLRAEVCLVLRDSPPTRLPLVPLMPSEAQLIAQELARALQLPEHSLREDLE